MILWLIELLEKLRITKAKKYEQIKILVSVLRFCNIIFSCVRECQCGAMVAQQFCKLRVVGSNPITGSINKAPSQALCLVFLF